MHTWKYSYLTSSATVHNSNESETRDEHVEITHRLLHLLPSIHTQGEKQGMHTLKYASLTTSTIVDVIPKEIYM